MPAINCKAQYKEGIGETGLGWFGPMVNHNRVRPV